MFSVESGFYQYNVPNGTKNVASNVNKILDRIATLRLSATAKGDMPAMGSEG